MGFLLKRYINLSQASVLFPVYTGARNYKALNRPFKILFYFFILAALFEIQSNLAIEIWQNNMPGLHLYTVIEFLAFSVVFYLHTQKDGWVRRLIVINLSIFIIIAIIEAFRYGIMATNDLSRSYSSVSMMLYALAYLYYLFTIEDTRYMWEYPMFWISIGALIYFAVNLPYFISKQLLINKSLGVEWGFYIIHETLNIIANCLYAQSFRCIGKQNSTK